MKLILIRHGEKNADGGLSETGRSQLRKLRTFLSDQKIDVVYCSPTDRCEQTTVDLLEGRGPHDAQISLSSLIRPKKKKETLLQLKSRVHIFIDDLRYDHEGDETVVVVSHNRVIRMFIYELTGEDSPIDTASTTIFEIKGDEAKLITVNNISYL